MKMDWCSYQAAKYAVEKWHYSHSMPASKLAKLGVWEDQFVGSVIYGVGATPEIGKPFGLRAQQVCELVRVALTDHDTPTSRIVAISLRMIQKEFSGLKMVVSFADTSQGHVGTIYQAGGWMFLGSKEYHAYRVNGEMLHPKTCHSRWGVGGQSVPWLRAHIDPQAERIKNGLKHKYVWAFDPELRDKLAAIKLPYPKKCVGSEPATRLAHQLEEGGSTPTPTL
jgi:hypothetical protein